jgi:MFS family permease
MGLGIFTLALGGVNFFLIRNHPPKEAPGDVRSTTKKSEFKGVSYSRVLRDKHFWLIGIAYLLTGFAIIIPFTFLSTYAVQELSFQYDSATLLITIIGVGAITGKLILGPVSDKLGRIKIMALCAILIAGGCLSMAFGRGWLLTVICFVYGIGYGACWSMYAACAADFFQKQAAGGIIGLWTFLLGVGSIFAPIAAGWSADATGTLVWAFIIAAAAGAVSLILLLPMLKVPQYGLVKNR